jgi:hypothetical protein
MNSLSLLYEISDLCSENRIIPFLGAGCSASILNCDWDSLIAEIAAQYNISDSGNMKIAQRFIDQYGKDKFCEFLKSKLSIDDFDDDKGYAYLAVASMAIGTIYTTNQDNVMEKCCEKHGFRYKSIITIEDLISAKIGEGLYLKYHGDYSVPKSVVFGEDDYLDRIDDKDYFIDIKLKADMLGRNILFIGYSFRDINLKLLFRRLKNVFGTIPISYMIVWELNEDLQKECNKYNIQIINPKEIYPDDDIPTAYFKTLNQFNDLVFQKKIHLSIDDFFNHKHSRKVVSGFEIDTLDRLLGTVDNEQYINKFRTKMDIAFIPDDFEIAVVRLFIRLSNSCSEKDVKHLNGLMFNLKLKNQFNIFITMVYFYVAHNSITKRSDNFSSYSYIGLSSYPEELVILALAVAFDVLTKHNIPISDYYRGSISIITDRSININALPGNVKGYITEEFGNVWSQKYTTYENPIKRQLRLQSDSINPRHNIALVCEMFDIVHDRNRNPYFDIMRL